MSKLSESSKLENYHRAISALPMEKQIAKQRNVHSPKTVRRMLSDKAPIQLVARFGHRLNEVTNPGLSHFEEGRILHTRAKIEEAKEKHTEAIKSNDLRGHIGLGHIGQIANTPHTDLEAARHLEIAIEKGIADAETYLLLGMIYFRNNRIDHAGSLLSHALRICPDPETWSDYVEALLHGLSGNHKASMKHLDTAAQKGFNPAIGVLINYHKGKKNSASIKKYLELAIKYGETLLLIKLGAHLKLMGDKEGAKKVYKMALNAGHTEAFEEFASLTLCSLSGLVEFNKEEIQEMEELKQICKDAIKAGIPGAYAIMASISSMYNSEEEAIDETQATHDVLIQFCQIEKFMDAIKFCKTKLKEEKRLYFFMSMAYNLLEDEANSRHYFYLGCQNINTPMAQRRELNEKDFRNIIIKEQLNEIGFPDEFLETLIGTKGFIYLH